MSKVSRGRSRLLSWLVLVIGLSVIVASLALQWWPADSGRADPSDAAQVATGKTVYEASCASCHGGQLQGQPDWQKRLPSGRMPAPPHNQNGHTWHHPDRMLFGIIRDGMVPPWAPPDYESDMPGFGGRLSDDEIWAVLAYIKSRWPQKVRDWQAEKSRQSR
ncbi:c-type cytochrome [Marinobacterium aestuariivivens]|uniref:C-type cytochrome n=1 Tax=Marinobacterium aestuariivivens TaxID=1698799 RepID=A0ABW1ZZK6_9GAMM